MVELSLAEQAIGPILCLSSEPLRPLERRQIEASPDSVMRGQHIARERSVGLRCPIADTRLSRHGESDENKTQNDEIATEWYERSLRTKVVKSCRVFDLNYAPSFA
jgi:hypothetical protein